ncbi:MAG: helix-turn-helix domain-containing protein [Bacteroidia bacterium]|jgi:excisionase family DNA binding protein
MEDLTFNDLPKAIVELQESVNEIKQLLLQKTEDTKSDSDELLTVEDTAKFLSLSVPTIYGLISKGDLPMMKRGKRCYFSKKELIEYLREGRRKTNSEIQREANNRTKRNSL